MLFTTRYSHRVEIVILANPPVVGSLVDEALVVPVGEGFPVLDRRRREFVPERQARPELAGEGLDVRVIGVGLDVRVESRAFGGSGVEETSVVLPLLLRPAVALVTVEFGFVGSEDLLLPRELVALGLQKIAVTGLDLVLEQLGQQGFLLDDFHPGTSKES